MNLNLRGKVALVCGSTQGLGKAAAVELASLGASVILIARNQQSLLAVQSELNASAGQQHGTLTADFSMPEMVKDRVGAYLRQAGPVHILVNNTGGPAGGPVLGAGTGEFAAAFSQHLLCNQILVQAVVPGMKSAGYGRIVNIISTSVKQPIPGLGVSNTIRGAVASWAKTLAGELAPFGITVNNVLPGMTRTARLEYVIRTRSDKSGRSIDDVTREMIAEIPAGRFGDPLELAAVVGFLASPSASYVTGTSIPVDGGRTSSL
jgi:3-oxoacyl-[acyl-carrier protein] reductase